MKVGREETVMQELSFWLCSYCSGCEGNKKLEAGIWTNAECCILHAGTQIAGVPMCSSLGKGQETLMQVVILIRSYNGVSSGLRTRR